MISYPKLSPSIIVLVRRGEEALLARNEAWPTGMFSTLAGFVEPGESIEQTVHREVSEEVGIRVKNIHYLGSQSWPFPNSLMLGFHADYDSGEIVCQEGEIAEAEWFKYDNLPNVPGNTAFTIFYSVTTSYTDMAVSPYRRRFDTLRPPRSSAR